MPGSSEMRAADVYAQIHGCADYDDYANGEALNCEDRQAIKPIERAIEAAEARGIERAAEVAMELADRYADNAREHDRHHDVDVVGQSREWDSQRGARMAARRIRALAGGEDDDS